MNYEPETSWLLRYIAENGREIPHTYADIGCAHPVNKSLTHAFRDLGWKGIAVDANAAYADDWQKSGFLQHFACALVSDQFEARFAVHENSFTSRISESEETDHREKFGINAILQKKCISLEALFLNACVDPNIAQGVGVMTVDVEGHEYAVLRTNDWEEYRPHFIVVEYVTSEIGTDPRACNLLLKNGYRVIHMTESNLIFERE